MRRRRSFQGLRMQGTRRAGVSQAIFGLISWTVVCSLEDLLDLLPKGSPCRRRGGRSGSTSKEAGRREGLREEEAAFLSTVIIKPTIRIPTTAQLIWNMNGIEIDGQQPIEEDDWLEDQGPAATSTAYDPTSQREWTSLSEKFTNVRHSYGAGSLELLSLTSLLYSFTGRLSRRNRARQALDAPIRLRPRLRSRYPSRPSSRSSARPDSLSPITPKPTADTDRQVTHPYPFALLRRPGSAYRRRPGARSGAESAQDGGRRREGHRGGRACKDA
jgi:hypothetical protein